MEEKKKNCLFNICRVKYFESSFLDDLFSEFVFLHLYNYGETDSLAVHWQQTSKKMLSVVPLDTPVHNEGKLWSQRTGVQLEEGALFLAWSERKGCRLHRAWTWEQCGCGKGCFGRDQVTVRSSTGRILRQPALWYQVGSLFSSVSSIRVLSSHPKQKTCGAKQALPGIRKVWNGGCLFLMKWKPLPA